jgi:hypothetical protein
MPDMLMARNILFAVVGCCIFIALGAFFGKRMTVPSLMKYAGIIALVAVVLGVIYIAYLLFAQSDPVSAVKDALLIVGVIVAACALMTVGGYFGKKAEVFRVVFTMGIIVLVAIVVFLIYLAYLAFFGGK